MEGLIYGGKFAFQNRLGRPYTVFALFYFVLEGNGGLHLEGRFNRGFFCITGLGGLYLEGHIHGGAYFRNFTII